MSNNKSNCSNCSAPTEVDSDNELTIQELFSSIAIIIGFLVLGLNIHYGSVLAFILALIGIICGIAGFLIKK